MSCLKRIKNIRDSLTKEANEVLVLGVIISHLDYANGIFKCNLKRLQRVQNVTAQLVLGQEAPQSNRNCLKSLLWLPIDIMCQIQNLMSGF